MRIIAFSDIHGSYKKVFEILSKESAYDAVIISGDLTTRGSLKEAEDAIKLFQSFGKPIFAVAGNMDSVEIENSFEMLGVSINGHGRILGNIGFFGVSASPFSPLHTPYEISEDEISKRILAGWRSISAAHWKICVPHAPPDNTKLDRITTGVHVGSTAVRKFIEAYQPHAVVCGHIHESRGTDMIGRTPIVNCGQAGKGYYAIIEVGEKIMIMTKES
jgi:uncharacterized protein